MLHNLEKAFDHEVRNWLEKSIPELTKYQLEKIRYDEIIRFAPFEFYKRRKKTKNFFMRLTIILYVAMWLVLFIGLPFNFIITGNWGYNKLKWFANWGHKIGVMKS